MGIQNKIAQYRACKNGVNLTPELVSALKGAGLDISVNTPLCRKNRDYEQTLALIHALGVRFVTVSGLICTGMAGINHGEYDLSAGEPLEIVKAAKAFCDTHGMANIAECMCSTAPMISMAAGWLNTSPSTTAVPITSWRRTRWQSRWSAASAPLC